MKAHSGHHFASVPYEATSDTVVVDGDNWLISPVLPGESQKIQFWVHNFWQDTYLGRQYFTETYDVMYSTTGSDIKDFKIIGETRRVEADDWQMVTVELPECTKYFAIHQNTPAATSVNFGIDDITYRRGVGMPVGYKIYRDGILIKKIDNGDTLSFLDESLDNSEDEYQVTAVYADGQESIPAVLSITNDIKGIHNNGNPFDVYSVGGQLLKKNATSLKGLQPGVYVVKGHKVIVR